MSFRNPLTTLPFSAISGRITTSQITPGSITTPLLAAGAVTTDKLTVSGVANILPDPSFETAAGAALVAAAGFPWFLDTTKGGNGSPTSVGINWSTAGSATTWSVLLAPKVPTLPGDQWYLQTDYAATAFTGNSLRMYAQWFDAHGNTLSWGTIIWTPTTDGAWRTVSGTWTAPANATSASFWLQVFNATAATAWFDNCVVRPVLGTTSIQAGAIKTGQLDANAINGMTITGATIQTAASGARVVMQNDTSGSGEDLTFYSGTAGEIPGSLAVGTDTGGSYVHLYPPIPSGYGGQLTEISMENNPTGNTGSVTITSDVLAITGKLINNLSGQTIINLVQDWSGALTLASGYTQNGNSEGNVEYRILTILGTTFVQWRGGFNATYSSGNPVNSGNFLASPLPSIARPSARRTVAAPCSGTNSTSLAMKVDANTDGTFTLVSAGSANNPPWVSLNGVMYSL